MTERDGKIIPPGGDLYGDDWDRLVESVRRVIGRFRDTSLALVEVGIGSTGATGRDLIAEITYETIFEYFGVDAYHRPEYIRTGEYTHVHLPSHIAIHQITREIHWCLIDACHCVQCCMRDVILYSNKMIPGGEICIHDASPPMQGHDGEWQDYPFARNWHDAAIARRDGVQVRKVLDSGMLAGLKLVLPAPPDQHRGGVEVFEKT